MPEAATRADALMLKTTGISGVELQYLHAVGTIPGVQVACVAARNGPGTGIIRSTGDGQSMQWRAPGSQTFGEVVWCGCDGMYLLEDGEDYDKWVRVQVYADYLFAGASESRIYLADMFNNVIGSRDFTATEAQDGSSLIYLFERKNVSGFDATDLKLWIDPDHVFDAVTGNGVKVWGGSDWVAPDSEDHPDVLMLDRLKPGEYVVSMARRWVAAGETAAPNLLECLHFSFVSYG